MSYKPLTREELEEEERLLAEQARLKAESDAYYEAMEEEYYAEMEAQKQKYGIGG